MPWNKRVCSTILNFPSDNDVLGTCGCGGPHIEVSKKQARRRYVTHSCMSFLEYWYISLGINFVSSLPLPVSHHKETNLINKTWWSVSSSVRDSRWNWPLARVIVPSKWSPVWCLPQSLRCQSQYQEVTDERIMQYHKARKYIWKYLCTSCWWCESLIYRFPWILTVVVNNGMLMPFLVMPPT